jgi:putative transposase
MPITKQLLDELMKEYTNPEDLLGETGLLNQLKKALIERALEGELTHHLGYEKHSPDGNNSGNSRNGHSKKRILSKDGQFSIKVPRDRQAEFQPQLIKKNQRRFDGFDDKVISMYARGMTTREIQAHLQEIYSVEVSPDFISTITDSVLEEVKQWQSRPLDAFYPILLFDALRVHVKQDGRVFDKSIYVVLGVNRYGLKEVLGLWAAQTEGAKFWLSVMTELHNRGLKDVLIACVDGLKGLPEAIESVFTKTQVQLCVIHQVRNSLAFVSYKDRKEVAADLKAIYSAATLAEAEVRLDELEEKWSARYAMIARSWRANWARLTVMFNYSAEIRRATYTTNAIESMNMSLRKIIKNRGLFPNDEAVFKLLYLALRNISKKWTMPIKNWAAAMNQFAILFPERVPLLMN